MKKKIVILGISSDIGRNLALKFFEKEYEIVGTYNSKGKIKKKEFKNYSLVKINASKISKQNLKILKKKCNNWDTVISCFGILTPIGKIFDLNIKNIKQNFDVNFFSNLQILKEISKIRKKKSNIFLFSGSGSNSPAPGLSSYTLSKLLLIKLSELLSDEYKDINCTTIGPGYINTKIHKQLIKNKNKAKDAYNKYLSLKIKNEQNSDSYNNLFDLIYQCIKNPKISRGRNFSCNYDKWRNNFSKIKKNIISNSNLFKLRRKN